MIYSGHQGYLDDIAATVREVELALRPHKQRFDFLAVTGMSGVLVGSPVAIRLHRPLVVLRKEGDACHSRDNLINASQAAGRYLILDDFISLGCTYDRLRRRFDTYELAMRTRYAGTYMYSDGLLSWDGDKLIDYNPEQYDRRPDPLPVPEQPFRALAELTMSSSPKPLTPPGSPYSFEYDFRPQFADMTARVTDTLRSLNRTLESASLKEALKSVNGT